MNRTEPKRTETKRAEIKKAEGKGNEIEKPSLNVSGFGGTSRQRFVAAAGSAATNHSEPERDKVGHQ